MENQPIQFKKERDFGELFNATFAFIRQEFSKFGKMMLYYVVPFLLALGILMVLVQKAQINSMTQMSAQGNFFGMFGRIGWYSILTGILALFTQAIILANTYGYIYLYVEKGKDGFTIKEVWDLAKTKLLSVIGASIVVSLIVGLGFVLCIIPGIYLGVSLSVIFIVMFYEKKEFGDAFSRSFDLTKLDFWNTLLILVVLYVIVIVIGYVLAIPTMAAGVGSMLTSVRTGSEVANMSTGIIILSTIINVVSYLLYTIPYVAISFQYFNLLEKKEKPSLEEKINNVNQ